MPMAYIDNFSLPVLVISTILHAVTYIINNDVITCYLER